MTAELVPGFRTADFAYDLPLELIAQAPPPERGTSRLLVVRRDTGTRHDTTFDHLPSLIPPGDLVVINTTKVRHARFLGTRPSGAPAEVLLIHPSVDDRWVALGKPGSAMQPGKHITLADGVSIETTEILPNGHRVVRFVGATASDAINRFGRLPLPPYIDREPTDDDERRYQTVYADVEGSVAAPTAGLHFTPTLLAALTTKGVTLASLDLQVGPGTFKPVETDDLSEHPMHPEHYEISAPLAAQISTTRASGHKVWAVGTTVVRALESAASPDGHLTAQQGDTTLMITPGYRFRVVDHLLTNFHLPRSTLLMLVSAFAGYERTMQAYQHAVAERYRFYSYGDAMVVI